jgi:hypothetical protein
VSFFNAALNQVADRFAVVSNAEQLHRLLATDEVAFGMSNPPFLAVPGSLQIDEQSRSLLSNVPEIRDTPHGAVIDVKAAFPQAGWGGEDGLDVTKHFIDVLRSVQGPGSKIVIYSQFAGDEHGPSIIQSYVARTGGFECAYEPVESGGGLQRKAIQTATESAGTVARLLTAALFEKQRPERLRIAIREGGPEHALMENLAAQIEASYRRLGISHFHDGFVHLVCRSRAR